MQAFDVDHFFMLHRAIYLVSNLLGAHSKWRLFTTPQYTMQNICTAACPGAWDDRRPQLCRIKKLGSDESPVFGLLFESVTSSLDWCLR